MRSKLDTGNYYRKQISPRYDLSEPAITLVWSTVVHSNETVVLVYIGLTEVTVTL